MQPYDIAMILVLLAATIFGAYKGMAWQIASLASIFLSYFVALNFSSQLAPVLSDQEPWNRFLAMAILYLGTTFVVWMAFRFVRETINQIQLKEFDRQVGGVFGAGKGVVYCVALTFFAVTLSQSLRDMVLKSKSGHYIAKVLYAADPVMPTELHNVLDPYLNRLEQELEPIEKPPAGHVEHKPRKTAGAAPLAKDAEPGPLESFARKTIAREGKRVLNRDSGASRRSTRHADEEDVSYDEESGSNDDATDSASYSEDEGSDERDSDLESTDDAEPRRLKGARGDRYADEDSRSTLDGNGAGSARSRRKTRSR